MLCILLDAHDSHHSVFSLSRQSPRSKMKESPAGSWCSCFGLGKPSSGAKRQLQHNAREPSETEVVVLAGKGANPASKTLLFSNIEFMLTLGFYLLLAFQSIPNSFSSPLIKNHFHNSACESLTPTLVYPSIGESSPCQPRRVRASSDDGRCASINAQLLGSTNRCASDDSLPHNNSDGHKALIQVQALISPSSAEDADLSLPATAVTSLDCEPAPLQCSPAQAQSECPDSSTSMQEQVSISEEKQSLLEGDLESGLQPQAPGSSTESSEPLSP